jgi:hypothetical protein
VNLFSNASGVKNNITCVMPKGLNTEKGAAREQETVKNGLQGE